MGKKNVRNSGNNDRYQIEDDFEDFGYDIKNIRRSSKKKVAKFKREQDHYDDSYWTVHHVLTGWQNGVLYRSRQEFTCKAPTASPSEPKAVTSWCSLRRYATPRTWTSNLSDWPTSGWTCCDSLVSPTSVSVARGDTWRTVHQGLQFTPIFAILRK